MVYQLVFPGLDEVLAKFELVNILINEDFPTFDLPINAYSAFFSMRLTFLIDGELVTNFTF